MILLLTGGSGCGKSTFAEKVIDLLPKENRVYIATMRVYDDESVKRVERHRAARANRAFTTLEIPLNLAAADVPEGSTVLLEDLPNLLANEMFSGGDPARILPALKELAGKCLHLVIVTNETGSDGIRYDETTTEYIRLLAELNGDAAALADSVAEVVYSIPVWLKGEPVCAVS